MDILTFALVVLADLGGSLVKVALILTAMVLAAAVIFWICRVIYVVRRPAAVEPAVDDAGIELLAEWYDESDVEAPEYFRRAA